jgi:predicted DNA-binding transcriptional regulator YafY
MYRVDRISALIVGDETAAFRKPRGFDIKAAVDSQPWETGGGPPVEATVRFDAEVAWWAARSLGVAEPSGELVTKVSVSNTEAFVGWILSFGASAEVIAPVEMRTAVVDRVSQALERVR